MKDNEINTNNNVKKTKTKKVRPNKEKKKRLLEIRAQKRKKEEIEKERIRAEKRIELEKIKRAKKEEKERLKNLKQKEIEDRRVALLLKKQQIKEEKMRLKQDRKTKRAEHKAYRKNRRVGYGGWLASVISLGITVLALSTILGIQYFTPNVSKTALTNSYQHAYYETLSYVDSIDTNLSKVINSKDSSAKQKYLMVLAVDAELCESNLNLLPLNEESKYYTSKLVNQIADFSKYLNEKLIDNKELTNNDIENLVSLYNLNKTLKDGLSQVNSQIEGLNFSELMNKNSKMLTSFDQLKNISVNYPELIYDGPFSDGEKYEVINGNDLKEISIEEGLAVFNKALSVYGISNIEFVGETNGDITTYNFKGNIDMVEVYGEVSKNGGKLLLFTFDDSTSSTMYDSNYCIEKAVEFIEGLGYTNMEDVWVEEANNEITINFACNENGVIVYPDMVKVNVSQQTGRITGIEASRYFINHKERSIQKAKISKASAKERVSSDLEIVKTQLTIIPKINSEVLAYEFTCESDGEVYYVYIDALTGKQTEMFKVVNTYNGVLLV